MNAPVSHRPIGLHVISFQDDEADEAVALLKFGTFDDVEIPESPSPPKEAAEEVCVRVPLRRPRAMGSDFRPLILFSYPSVPLYGSWLRLVISPME